jgi:hypothetical protein
MTIRIVPMSAESNVASLPVPRGILMVLPAMKRLLVERMPRPRDAHPKCLRWLVPILSLVWIQIASAGEPPPVDRYEPGVLPVLGQDPDLGFKFGVFTQLVRFRDDSKPYTWRLRILASASVRDGATGTEFPYREALIHFDRPHAFVDPLRITLFLDYLRTTNLGYFGVGNATPAKPLWQGLDPNSDAYVLARHFYQYDGVTPMARATGRYRLMPGWEVMTEVYTQWVSLNVYQGSLLEQDRDSASGPSLGSGLQLRAAAGVIHNTRNHETVATRGYYNEATFRCGSAAQGGDGYCALNVTLRGYWSILGERLSLAVRALGDVEFGHPPLIELTRYGGMEFGYGPGGTRGIRGVPQGRLAGKSKAIANMEVRSFFLPFSLGSQRFVLGAVAFADAGRVWANAFSASDRDGSFRLHWGAGGGPRLRWGDSLLIRADVAYAPLGADLKAVPAIYIDVEQVM